MIKSENIKALLEAPFEVRVFDELPSTNTTAREIAINGDKREQVVFARRQTNGRGRLGRSFYSGGCGIYMSLLLYPKSGAADALHITTAAAVAVSRAVDRVAGVRCEIKWVNDVYLGGKKICGILTEGQLGQNGLLDFAVLGIGLNLVVPDGGFPNDIAMRAGAVFDVMPDGADNVIAANIINEFYRIYNSDTPYISEYRERSNLIGREVDVMRIVDGDVIPARVLGIGEDFSLTVEFWDGKTESLSSGEVSIREK